MNKPTCPECNAVQDGSTCVTGAEDTAPDVDDISICAYCAHVSRFDENLQLRTLTQEEFDALDPQMRFEISRARFATMVLAFERKKTAGKNFGTHNICDECWESHNKHGMQPVRLTNRKWEKCCFCGDVHQSGIYLRWENDDTLCKGTCRETKDENDG